jgi:hypothetical protein
MQAAVFAIASSRLLTSKHVACILRQERRKPGGESSQRPD